MILDLHHSSGTPVTVGCDSQKTGLREREKRCPRLGQSSIWEASDSSSLKCNEG